MIGIQEPFYGTDFSRSEDGRNHIIEAFNRVLTSLVSRNFIVIDADGRACRHLGQQKWMSAQGKPMTPRELGERAWRYYESFAPETKGLKVREMYGRAVLASLKKVGSSGHTCGEFISRMLGFMLSVEPPPAPEVFPF